MMRAIQCKILPKNWLKSVKDFDIYGSELSENNKIIATYLIPIILEEKEKSLCDPLLKILVKSIIDNTDFLEHYKNLPLQVVEDAFNEIHNERGVNLTRKLNSLFSEFLTYLDLYEKGYEIVDSKRVEGSCDLVMRKNNEIYNFEVKLKESPDIGISRLNDYIEGYSLLEENAFLRGQSFGINLKVDNLKDSNLKDIFNEIDSFIEQQQNIYDGEFLQIFNTKNRNELNRDIDQSVSGSNNFIIDPVEDVDKLINDIFMGKRHHLTKIINKSKKYESEYNFTGCLIWSIPFYKEIAGEEIKKSFKKINLDFDLFVYITGHGYTPFNFFVAKKKSFI